MSNKKILVIDDDEKIRKILSIRLVKAGYEVVTASNGFEALRGLDRLNPDLVITDVVMPKVTGRSHSSPKLPCQGVRSSALLPGPQVRT